MIDWRIHHRSVTASTNADARAGVHGDVFTADFQTSGRGRLGHRWLSEPGMNLTMSCVLSVEGLGPSAVATFPLVVGLAVAQAAEDAAGAAAAPQIKWPNDVFVGGRKLAGILCERVDDVVVAGIGVNVGQRDFPADLAGRATSFARILPTKALSPAEVRGLVLARLAENYAIWRRDGFAALLPAIGKRDFLRGKRVSVRRTDEDAAPIRGVVSGILSDGSLGVGGERVFSGEAHVDM